jgi:hypothetical protein
MMQYDLIYLFTAIGLTTGGSRTLKPGGSGTFTVTLIGFYPQKNIRHC